MKKVTKVKPQTIVVSFAKLKDFEREISVDSDICDDIYLEACTQAIELNIKDKKLIMVPFIEARIKDEPDKKKFKLYNAYKVLINASYHRYAKILRAEFKKINNIDLDDGPICSQFEEDKLCQKKSKTK